MQAAKTTIDKRQILDHYESTNSTHRANSGSKMNSKRNLMDSEASFEKAFYSTSTGTTKPAFQNPHPPKQRPTRVKPASQILISPKTNRNGNLHQPPGQPTPHHIVMQREPSVGGSNTGGAQSSSTSTTSKAKKNKTFDFPSNFLRSLAESSELSSRNLPFPECSLGNAKRVTGAHECDTGSSISGGLQQRQQQLTLDLTSRQRYGTAQAQQISGPIPVASRNKQNLLQMLGQKASSEEERTASHDRGGSFASGGRKPAAVYATVNGKKQRLVLQQASGER